MGRPKSAPEERRTQVITGRLTPAEEAAWFALKRDLGGVLQPNDSDALRFLLAEACAKRGIPWPDDTKVTESPVSTQPGATRKGGGGTGRKMTAAARRVPKA